MATISTACRNETQSRAIGRRDSEAGLSMVELLMGMVIAVLLIGAAMVGVTQHQTQRRVHGEQILAMSACRNMLETLRSVDMATLPTLDGQGFEVLGQNGEARGLMPIEGDADGMAGEIRVQAHARSQTSNPLYVVTARARWRGATRGGNFAMTTLMGERR